MCIFFVLREKMITDSAVFFGRKNQQDFYEEWFPSRLFIWRTSPQHVLLICFGCFLCFRCEKAVPHTSLQLPWTQAQNEYERIHHHHVAILFRFLKSSHSARRQSFLFLTTGNIIINFVIIWNKTAIIVIIIRKKDDDIQNSRKRRYISITN